MIVAFSISPSGGDETGGVSQAVAEAVRVVRASGLPNETNAMFTNVEGEWDEVMAVVKQAVAGLGLDRADRDAEARRGLLLGEVLVVAQHDHRSLPRRQ